MSVGADLGAVDKSGITAAVIGFYSLASYLLGEGDNTAVDEDDERVMGMILKFVERMGVADMEKV